MTQECNPKVSERRQVLVLVLKQYGTLGDRNGVYSHSEGNKEMENKFSNMMSTIIEQLLWQLLVLGENEYITLVIKEQFHRGLEAEKLNLKV